MCNALRYSVRQRRPSLAAFVRPRLQEYTQPHSLDHQETMNALMKAAGYPCPHCGWFNVPLTEYDKGVPRTKPSVNPNKRLRNCCHCRRQFEFELDNPNHYLMPHEDFAAGCCDPKNNRIGCG